MSATAIPADVRQVLRPAMTPQEKWERLAFTFCRMGTTGLIVWALSPAIFVLLVSIVAVAFYGRAVWVGVSRTRCLLRRPSLVIAFWLVVGGLDAVWLFGLGQRLPT
jgi:hypothetical protein